MREIKPHTAGRQKLAPDQVEVTGAVWWRAWATPERLVVVADGAAASARSHDGRDVVVVALPE